jgi:hypothetical protein
MSVCLDSHIVLTQYTKPKKSREDVKKETEKTLEQDSKTMDACDAAPTRVPAHPPRTKGLLYRRLQDGMFVLVDDDLSMEKKAEEGKDTTTNSIKDDAKSNSQLVKEDESNANEDRGMKGNDSGRNSNRNTQKKMIKKKSTRKNRVGIAN